MKVTLKLAKGLNGNRPYKLYHDGVLVGIVTRNPAKKWSYLLPVGTGKDYKTRKAALKDMIARLTPPKEYETDYKKFLDELGV